MTTLSNQLKATKLEDDQEEMAACLLANIFMKHVVNRRVPGHVAERAANIMAESLKHRRQAQTKH